MASGRTSSQATIDLPESLLQSVPLAQIFGETVLPGAVEDLGGHHPSGVSKLEGGTIYVPDFRLFYLAQAFRVQITDLLPNIDLLAPVHETILRFIRNEKRGFVPELITPTSCDVMKSLARPTRL